MDLSSYLQDHPYLQSFKPSDQEAVLSLAKQSPMKIGGIELLYDRSPKYQALLRCQGPKQLTIIAKDKGELLFVYSFSTAKKWIHGKLENCAYIGDFRTNQSRKAATVWRKYYAEFLSVLKADTSFNSPKYILTAILKKNKEALRNLTMTKKDFGFRYDFLSELNMVNVYGQWPWTTKSPVHTEKATLQDRDALLAFLRKCEKEKIFGANLEGNDSDWNLREKSWPGYAVENFLIQKNSNGDIVACTFPWDPGFAKRMTVTKAPKSLTVAFSFLKLAGFSMPKLGESLKTLYMTHLNIQKGVDESQAIQSFLQYLLKIHKDYHMISFADEIGVTHRLKGFITQKIEVMLYLVALTEEAQLQKGSQCMSFEMALV